ncbi:hypothetical protein ABZ543_08115 [Streptomyces roseifaciens]
MGCACGNKNRQLFEVVADGGNGDVLHPGAAKATADAVARRHPGSIVREKGTAQPKTFTPPGANQAANQATR